MVYFSYVDSSRMVSVVMGTGSDLKSQMQKKGMKVYTNIIFESTNFSVSSLDEMPSKIKSYPS